MLSEFARRGLNRLTDFQAFEWQQDSKTTGSVLACDTLPKVNVNKLDRGIRKIAGTMVHERVHSFCQRHRYQERAKDKCDLAYLAGSLTIALDIFRSNGSRPFASGPDMCAALRRRLQSHGILQ